MKNFQIQDDLSIKSQFVTLVEDAINLALENNKNNSPYIRLRALSEYLQVSKSTLLKWQKMGMPSIVIDGVVLFSKNEVTQWLKQFEM